MPELGAPVRVMYLEEGCLMASANASFAARFLALHADLRERIEKDEAFQNWLDHLQR